MYFVKCAKCTKATWSLKWNLWVDRFPIWIVRGKLLYWRDCHLLFPCLPCSIFPFSSTYVVKSRLCTSSSKLTLLVQNFRLLHNVLFLCTHRSSRNKPPKKLSRKIVQRPKHGFVVFTSVFWLRIPLKQVSTCLRRTPSEATKANIP